MAKEKHLSSFPSNLTVLLLRNCMSIPNTRFVKLSCFGIQAPCQYGRSASMIVFCVCYLDNEAARGASSLQSPTFKGNLISEDCLRLEDSAPWFGRVSTHSNCAVNPSRGSFDHLFAKKTRCDYLSASWPF